jgi:hypothetical protein
VPTSWLIEVEGKTRSYWPPTHIANKITKKDFQSKNYPKPESKWTLHNVRCLTTDGKLFYMVSDERVILYPTSMSLSTIHKMITVLELSA